MNKAKEISALYKDIKQQMGRLVSLCHEVESHAEYTEQVKKEAYEQGYADGRKKHEVEIHAIAYTNGKQDGYQKGLNDAWDAARKFMSEVIDARFRNNFMVEIFECDNAMGTMKVYSASECIEKIRQYEQEKEKDGLRQNIQTIVDQCGYSLDEIAEVLQKMKETE